LEAAQMRFLGPLLGYLKLDLKRNVDIREWLKVQSIIEEIRTYQKNWKEHIERMQDERLPKLALKYQSVGKQSRGRPRKLERSSWKRVENTRLTNLVNSSGRRRAHVGLRWWNSGTWISRDVSLPSLPAKSTLKLGGIKLINFDVTPHFISDDIQTLNRGYACSVSVVSALRLDDWGSIPNIGKWFFLLCPTWFWDLPSLLSRYWRSFPLG
jgi:hypothetical protein